MNDKTKALFVTLRCFTENWRESSGRCDEDIYEKHSLIRLDLATILRLTKKLKGRDVLVSALREWRGP